MVLEVDAPQRTFTAWMEAVPGFMGAMTMPFTVQDARALAGLVPGATVEFTLVVGSTSSWAEQIRVRRYQGLEQDPLAARRLALLRDLTRGPAPPTIAIGTPVPDFTLIDQKRRRFSLSSVRGQVVAINFIYTTCQLPEFCLRIANHFGVLQQRFASRLGRDLVLLTITFDPARDTPEVLDAYASQWKPNPDTWRFLTGGSADIQRVLDLFGVSAFPNDGLMDHTLRTALIDREGRLLANIEGNQYTTEQLVALTAAALR
jgi:protein SCO1/2